MIARHTRSGRYFAFSGALMHIYWCFVSAWHITFVLRYRRRSLHSCFVLDEPPGVFSEEPVLVMNY
jgi:hypothetical protein